MVRSRARRLSRAVVSVLVVMAVAGSVWLSMETSGAGTGVATVMGHPVLTVASGSMSPVLRTGDLIFDRPIGAVAASDLAVGQVISFRANGDQIYTHRIVGVVRSPSGGVAYRTKGDANNASDSTLRPAASVIGVYWVRIPHAGYFLASLHRPWILSALLAGPVLLVLGLELVRRGREERRGQVQPAGST